MKLKKLKRMKMKKNLKKNTKTNVHAAQGEDATIASCSTGEFPEISNTIIQDTVGAITHLQDVIRGNNEVLRIMKLFPSEKPLQKDLQNTISGQKRVLKQLKQFLKELKDSK